MWTAHHKGQGINRLLVIVKGFRQEVKRCLISVVIMISGIGMLRDHQPLCLFYGNYKARVNKQDNSLQLVLILLD